MANLQEQGMMDPPPGMVVGASGDIDAHVSTAIRATITKGEYIDIASYAPFALNDKGNHLSIVDGQITVRPKASLPKIMDIAKWTDAFMIFINIYVWEHPEKIQELMKYMRTVRLRAKRYGGSAF